MPIVLKTFSVQNEWEGCTWEVPSVSDLAEAIAIVALGQASHVSKILSAAQLAPHPTTQGAIDGAYKLLKLPEDYGPYHRDGWIFQVMSWLAAQIRSPGAHINVPHMIHAHKGLDGLQVNIDANNNISAVIIFEDKATCSPRDMIRQKVWPDFRNLETGENEHLITSEVTSLLARAKHPDPEAAVASVMWSQTRRYRLSINDKQSTEKSQKSLFKGYTEIVEGAPNRRRAEVFVTNDLRKWMDDLACQAAKCIPNIAKIKTS